MPTSSIPVVGGQPSAWRPLALAALVMIAGGAAQAQQGQGQSMEERLRAQLRTTTTQLQQAQNELALLKAKSPQGSGASAAAVGGKSEIEQLKKDLAQARAQLSAERQAREKTGQSNKKVQEQATAATEKATAQLSQYRTAYDELLKLARASDAERQRLTAQTTRQSAAIAQCEAKNVQLYSVGQEVLRAYETLDVGSVMSARQPFATQSRVKLDQIAQQYGDKLYEGRFDARSVNAPAPAVGEAKPSATATPQP